MFKFLALFLLAGFGIALPTGYNSDVVCGKWLSVEKNLMVQVYKDEGVLKAKVIWFLNTDKTKTMEDYKDILNPDPSLRDRKLLGMSILKDMDYFPKSNTWENGKIYDAKNGREWDASAYIDKEGQLKVTGYWHFKFIGRTLTFTRVRD